MPEFAYEPQTSNDKSMLTPNWHPAYLMAIADEETPQNWEMAKKSPRLWRWQFAVWESPGIVLNTPPEFQSVPTAQKFTPPGRFQASKAFIFTQKLLGRKIELGERVNLDPMMPFPCLVLIGRTDKNGAPIEYANVIDIGPWPDGQAALTPALRQQLATWLAMKTGHAGQGASSTPTASASVPPPAPPIPPPVQASMPPPPVPATTGGWGAPPATPATTKPSW